MLQIPGNGDSKFCRTSSFSGEYLVGYGNVGAQVLADMTPGQRLETILTISKYGMFIVETVLGAQWQQAMLKGLQATARIAEDDIHTPKTVSFVSVEMACGSGSELCPSGWDTCIQQMRQQAGLGLSFLVESQFEAGLVKCLPHMCVSVASSSSQKVT